jgi:hypothetical protein
MKKITTIFSAVLLGLFTQSMSCETDRTPPPGECAGDIACTMMFSMVNVEVKDQNGNKVILDEHYTIREKDGQRLKFQQNGIDSNSYTVIDDSFISTLKSKTELFRFIGKKNGVEIVNEQYEINGDCCHVNKVNGKGTVIIP